MRRTDDINKNGGKSRFIATIDGEPLTRLCTDDVTNNKITDDVNARVMDGPSQNDEEAPGFGDQQSTCASEKKEKNENEAQTRYRRVYKNQNGFRGLRRQRPKADGR